MSNVNQVLYPQVGPAQVNGNADVRAPTKPKDRPGEFDQMIATELNSVREQPDLSQVRSPLKLSAHANQRLQERKIQLDQNLVSRINQAVDQANAKGIEDALVITDRAAFIVNVGNRTIVTAMDRGSVPGNVFTNIDGAVIV